MENKELSIFHSLRHTIVQGIVKPDDILPSENQLAEKYEVSRETVRKALARLVDQGLIIKQRGKGSIVLPTTRFNFPINGLTSFKELQQQQHIPSSTTVIKNHYIEPPDFLVDQQMVKPNSLMWQIKRQRIVQGTPAILDIDYIIPDLVPQASDEELEISLYDYLEKQQQLKINFAQKEITVDQATDEDRTYLDPEANHVVVVRSYVYLDDARFFQFTESRHVLERFRFVDIAHRNPEALSTNKKYMN